MFVIVINEGDKNIISGVATGGFLEEKVFLRRAYTMKYFFHRWLDFFFDSFLSTFNTFIQLQNVNESFQSTIMKVFQKKKIFTRFLINIFSSEIHFTNQRSNLYWKWRKWLCEVNTKEEMNENLKTCMWQENREKSE